MSAERYEKIKNRMIKKAATIWGVAPTEIENTFDPVVSLLIAACASEIVNLENDLDESYNRVTEKIIQLMTPETVVGAEPAHGVMQIIPTDDIVALKPEFQFFFKKKIIEDNTSVKNKNIFFSPAKNFNIVNATIKYLIASNTFFEYDETGIKNTVSDLKNSDIKDNKLLLGIKTPLNTLNLNDVSFYFNTEEVENRDLFFHYLKNTKWSINGKTIEKVNGFASTNTTSDREFIETIFTDASAKIQKSNNKAVSFYKKHYITLKTKGTFFNPKEDNAITPLLEKNKLSVQDDVLWVEVEFPSILSNKMKSINCSINAFPAVNRELNQVNYQVKEFINIVPVETEDFFFDIKSVVSIDGKPYLPKGKSLGSSQKGTYTLRDNSVGKLDHRTAREYLFHLLELLKNESASFSLMNTEFIAENLKNLNQILSLLNKKAEDAKVSISETNYVMLNPNYEKENIFVNYWTTNGEEANNIKKGSLMESYKVVGIGTQNGIFLTKTQGGRNDLSMNERLNSYRRSLLSKGKIVTKEDIKALCFDLCGDRITNATVSRTFINSHKEKKGIIRCIEIKLKKNNAITTPDFEWKEISSSIISLLESESLNIYPYKITLLN